MAEDLDNYSTAELTEKERQEIRRIIDGDRHLRWLRQTIRNLALWVGAVVTTIIVFGQFIKDVLKRLIE